MKTSPIQLLDAVFEEISIEANSGHEPRIGGQISDDIRFETISACEPLPDFWNGKDVPIEGVQDRTYVINLAIRTSAEGRDIYPYVFQIKCAGVVACIKEKVSNNLSARDAALEYGLSLLYGMVRDQVLQCTSRMSRSTWMLPTVSFMGDSKQKQTVQTELPLESIPKIEDAPKLH